MARTKSSKLPFSLDPLDTRLVLPKPKNSVEDEKIFALEKAGNALYTRKRDGHCVTVVITGQKSNRIKLYTRGETRDITENFPHIIAELQSLKYLIPSCVFSAELYAEKNNRDWREHVSRLAASDIRHSAEYQHLYGYAKLLIFNVLVYGGKDVSIVLNEHRLKMLSSLFQNLTYVKPIEYVIGTFQQAQAEAIKNGWEGLVVYDKTKPTTYRLDGNKDRPPRPDGCWKRKPSYEDDFIATGWVKGTPGKRHEDRMGKILLAQQHSATGKNIPCGEVGIGFSDTDREFFANDKKYPCVVQVEFERRFPPRKLSRGRVQCALCNPRFVRRRTDKKSAGCVLPDDLAEQMSDAKMSTEKESSK